MALENDLYGSASLPPSQDYLTSGTADNSATVGGAVYAELSTNEGAAVLTNPYETPKSLRN